MAKRDVWDTAEETIASEGTTDRRRILEGRLEDGYRRIEEARVRGLDIRKWEDFWLQLLDEYEAVCDHLGRKAA